MVEQVLVDGDGSECGGCNEAQVTPSTEIRECANGMCVKDACERWIALVETEEGAESMALVASMVASMASMVASMASNVASMASMSSMASMMVASMASMDGVDGFDDWRRMVVTGVFDTEGTDEEVTLCPQ